MDILRGVSEYFQERGCYVHHFPESDPPYIKVHRHSMKGFVECQIGDDTELLLLYRRTDPIIYAWPPGSGIASARRPILHGNCRIIELAKPTALSEAFGYVKKYLFNEGRPLRGGIGDRIHPKCKR